MNNEEIVKVLDALTQAISDIWCNMPYELEGARQSIAAADDTISLVRIEGRDK